MAYEPGNRRQSDRWICCLTNPAERSDEIIAPVALVVVATLAGIWGTSALEEQAHDRELFAAYCIGVFGPDQSSLKSPRCLLV